MSEPDVKYEYEERLRKAEDADLQYQVSVLEEEIKGLRWFVREYEAALFIIKRGDIVEGIRSDFLK